MKPGLVVVLTWAGVRGGLSVAMALSLPPSSQRSELLAATYAVVIFSTIVQSLTLERVIVRLKGQPPGAGHPSGRRLSEEPYSAAFRASLTGP